MILTLRSKEYVKRNYTHKGLMFGLLPVWVRVKPIVIDGEVFGMLDDRDDESEFPAMEERNWIPKPLFYFASMLYGAWLYSALSVHWEPPAPIFVYGEV